MISTDDLLRVRSGELSFDAFARVARQDFVKLAYKLTLHAPSWLDVDDVAQEMILSVPRALEQWRPGDYPLKRFVVFRACTAGRKVIKRARDYRGFESRLELRDDVLPPSQLAGVELKERVSTLLDTLPKTPLQRAVMKSLLHTQSMERSVNELIKHPDTRVMFAADDDLVRIKIRRVMAILAERAEDARQASAK